MESTPATDGYNADLLALMPQRARQIVEVGCSTGNLAREYLRSRPGCRYVGIEVSPSHAALARQRGVEVVEDDIERIDDDALARLAPSDCWVFGDVLEHMVDPWNTLQRLRRLDPGAHVVACIPNAQHWSFQYRLMSGDLRYSSAGLLDRTHLRWFTRTTIGALFSDAGYSIEHLSGRVFEEPSRERFLASLRPMAASLGLNPAAAAADATPLQWIVRAVPAG